MSRRYRSPVSGCSVEAPGVKLASRRDAGAPLGALDVGQRDGAAPAHQLGHDDAIVHANERVAGVEEDGARGRSSRLADGERELGLDHVAVDRQHRNLTV
jgi:hypothetical protein